LRDYNLTLKTQQEGLPEWFDIYSDDKPPKYWSMLADILFDEDKDKFVLEIGSGLGDIIALAKFLGFKKVLGIEREAQLSKYANEKIKYFFAENESIICDSYPMIFDRAPGILIQVNCVYYENMTSKKQMVKMLKEWYSVNGIPELYILELIDAEFIEKSISYPEFVRFSEKEVKMIYKDTYIQSFNTYKYPQNKSTKRMYLIRQRNK